LLIALHLAPHAPAFFLVLPADIKMRSAMARCSSSSRSTACPVILSAQPLPAIFSEEDVHVTILRIMQRARARCIADGIVYVTSELFYFLLQVCNLPSANSLFAVALFISRLSLTFALSQAMFGMFDIVGSGAVPRALTSSSCSRC
jgi:hypothetical protein